MKKLWFGILAIALVLGVNGCGDDPKEEIGPQVFKYVSTDSSGTEYTLTITGEGTTAAVDDSYELTIKGSGGTKVSKGTVTGVDANGKLTLKPQNNGSSTFDVTISGGKMTGITGPITVGEGETVNAPTGTLTPSVTPPSDGNGDGSLGSTLTIDAQTYRAEWTYDGEKENVSFKPVNTTVEGINYILAVDFTSGSSQAPSASLISTVLSGTNTVTLTGGKLNVNLGTPIATALKSLDPLKTTYPTLTLSTSGAKVFVVQGFTNSDNYDTAAGVQHVTAGGGQITYWYADKAVNISGTITTQYTWEDEYGQQQPESVTIVIAMNLKAGWNSVIMENTATGQTMRTGKPSVDDKWDVFNVGGGSGKDEGAAAPNPNG